MDISWVCEHLLNRLTDQNVLESETEKFHHLNEIDAKVSFVKNALIDLKYMKAIERSGNLRIEKSNDKSLEFRILGDEQLLRLTSSEQYVEVLELYNKSICFSESGSENLPIGYAKRSAVLFKLKLFRECVENIDLAREAANFPPELQHELDRREENCRQLLAEQAADVQPFEFMMFEDRHDTVPNIADCLEMRSSEAAGRFVCTTRDLEVGDMIATDEPFCTTLIPAMRYVRCATCKQENHLTLIPCEQCTSAMFCSETCCTIAKETFHKFECPIIDFLHTWSHDPIHCNAVRMCLSALDLFPTIVELMDFCANRENQNCSVFDLNYGNFTSREHYRAIHSLVTNQASRSLRNLYDISVACAVLEHFLIEHTPVKNFLGGVEGERFFRELLCRHMQTSSANYQHIDVIQHPCMGLTFQNHSVGVFAFISLLNHSCAPNTIRVYRGTKAYLFVLRPIPANGQLFDNYGVHFEDNLGEDRQRGLQMTHQFTCNCDACEHHYPLWENLPKYIIPSAVEEVDIVYLYAFDWRFALNNYRRYCEFLTEYSDEYPCEEIHSAENCLTLTLNILVDAVTLKAKYFEKFIIIR